ncbi:hypothetical protein ACFQ23_11405 [Schaalia naturae]|uniref:Uncharacterized protein n=1 Tax=Schaalia naturae TaxID=635203 RepID=A0ABW2SR47_9ACTO
MTQATDSGDDAPHGRPEDGSRASDSAVSAWLSPARRWDLTRTALSGAGLLLVVLAAVARGAWMSGASDIPMSALCFGATAVLVLIAVQGGSLAYVTGRWRALGGWAAGGVVVVALVLVALNTLSGRPPDSVSIPVPRLVVLVAGVLLVVIGASRNSDTVHERDASGDDWFVVTGRVLRATQFWNDEQAHEQMRRARAEFDHAQARRAQGSDPLTPREHFGSPEQYAASLTSRPSTAADPVRAGRWYYLISAIVLGVWALWRTYSAGMSWLAVVLFFFAVVAAAMFVWASLRSRRH